MNNIFINKIEYENYTLNAVASDSDCNTYVVSIGPKGYRVENREKKELEHYFLLKETTESRFYSVFKTLNKIYRSIHSYHSFNIFDYISDYEEHLYNEDGVYTALGSFKYAGQLYACSAVRNTQGDWPTHNFSLFDKYNELTETYDNLVDAEESDFYPVFTKLDRRIDSMEQDVYE